MAALIDDGTGLIFAEALTFALAARMPRPKAQEAVKALCREALETGTPLRALAERDFPATGRRSSTPPASLAPPPPRRAPSQPVSGGPDPFPN
jgi:3-carboxy-cis,cis-muconate cycloisomerase